jgi:hypothetical protein
MKMYNTHCEDNIENHPYKVDHSKMPGDIEIEDSDIIMILTLKSCLKLKSQKKRIKDGSKKAKTCMIKL